MFKYMTTISNTEVSLLDQNVNPTKMAFVTNNCGCLSFYFTLKIEYNHPFIGCLVVNDLQFIKLCQDFDRYMTIEPRFGIPNPTSVWASQAGNGGWYSHHEIQIPYPVMYLEDIEIHWIHETNSETVVDKYNRRRQRYLSFKPQPVFMWSDADLMNDHEDTLEKIVGEFSSIKNSLYITGQKNIHTSKRIIYNPLWENAPKGRDSSHIPLIHNIGDRVELYKQIVLAGSSQSSTLSISPITSSSPMDTRLVDNKTFLASYVGDYTYQLHYISDNSAQLFIQRHDIDQGWEEDNLTLIIDDQHYIYIPKSETSTISILVTTKIILYKKTYTHPQIPLDIIQTSETNVVPSKLARNAWLTVRLLNPEYNYKFFIDDDRREFIQSSFSTQVLNAYDLLNPGAFRADLFRYCYLLLFGGVYIDFKMIERVPLSTCIRTSDALLICNDYDKSNTMDSTTGTSYLNAFIASTPNLPLFAHLIQQIVYNTTPQQQPHFLNEAFQGRSQSILDVTGPTLFYKTFSSHIDKVGCVRFKHIIKDHDESIYSNFQIVDLDQQKTIFTKTYQGCSQLNKKTHYSTLWFAGQTFMRLGGEVGDWMIYIYPNIPWTDSFLFTGDVETNTLVITKKSKNGRTYPLLLKLTNKKDKRVIKINVDPIESNSHSLKVEFNLKNGKST